MNAGISSAYSRIETLKVTDMHNMFEVNTPPVVVLFQAVYLLLKNSKSPKFIAISTNAASIADLEMNMPFILCSYVSQRLLLTILPV